MNKQDYKELHSAIRGDLRRHGMWSVWAIETWRDLSDAEQGALLCALDGQVLPTYDLHKPYEYAESRKLGRHRLSDLLAMERRYRR